MTDGQLGSPDPGCGSYDLMRALGPLAAGGYFQNRLGTVESNNRKVFEMFDIELGWVRLGHVRSG